MTKKKYTYEYLIECLDKNNAKLEGEYNKINISSHINFICNCGKHSHKSFIKISNGNGAYCTNCTRTIKQKNKFNLQLLINTIKRDNAVLLEEYYLVTRNLDIKYKCNCGLHSTKKFRFIIEDSGAFCHKCTQNNRIEKVKKTSLIRFNTEFASQNNDVRQKFLETCRRKYNCDNPNQNKEIQEKRQKNARKYKEYIMPSGRIVKIQGYESFALDELLLIYPEEYITIERKNIPRIEYFDNSNKKHYYFPDIYIEIDNKIIEVKSTWTYKCKADNNELKAAACKKMGYDFEFWVYDDKKNKEIKYS
jgi:hypothetical protein